MRPRVVAAGAARGLRPADRVLGLRLDGTPPMSARAYPLNVLAYHRVVADVLDGRSVVVAFSPLSESARCAVTDPGERLRASGGVHASDDLLVDARSGASGLCCSAPRCSGRAPASRSRRAVRAAR